MGSPMRTNEALTKIADMAHLAACASDNEGRAEGFRMIQRVALAALASSPAATPNGEPSNVELRGLWYGAGGSFHGPNVETGAMPEEKLLPFLRSLIAARPT